MITNQVSIIIVDSVEEAPTYKPEEYLMLTIEECVIVGNGMESGSPSVDIQLIDSTGTKYLVMATGGIIESIGMAVAGKREKDSLDHQTH